MCLPRLVSRQCLLNKDVVLTKVCCVSINSINVPCDGDNCNGSASINVCVYSGVTAICYEFQNFQCCDVPLQSITSPIGGLCAQDRPERNALQITGKNTYIQTVLVRGCSGSYEPVKVVMEQLTPIRQIKATSGRATQLQTRLATVTHSTLIRGADRK